MANEFKIKNGLILDGISSGSSSTEVLVLNTSTNKIESKQIDTLSGISGESGLSGNVGISGQVGVSGISGVSGQVGTSGISGQVGISGLSGVSGTSGFSGLSGLSGQVGTSGSSGLSGTSGFSGLSGQVGISGLSGLSGTSGFSGLSGQVGISGLSGQVGTSGLSGLSGQSGFSGLSGTSGFSGLSGQVGTSGLSGRSGISGFQGTSGFSGNSGESGLSGVSGDIGVLSGSYGNPNGTLTGPYPNNILYYDSNGSVWQWNTSSWNQIGDISGISGYSGISGDSGISGELGVSGFSGVSGRSGISGLSGQVGTSGLSGQVGTSGFSGLSGQVGISGLSGTSGFSGLSGQVGTSGLSGQSGFSGLSGNSGFSGLSGLVGTSGFSGLSGQVGTSGLSGLSGLSGSSGISGFQGVQGFSGESGTSGESGISGESGTSGFFGISGYSGESGLSGFFGFSGYSGESGISGISGQSGILPAGVDGATPFYSGSSWVVNNTNIYNNGSIVGIGTTSPTAKLQLRGTGSTSSSIALRVEGSGGASSLIVNDAGKVAIGTNITPNVSNVYDLTTSYIICSYVNSGRYDIGGVAVANYTGGIFVFGEAGWNSRFDYDVVNINKKLGVNVSSPGARFHVKSSGSTSATYNSIFENGSNVQIAYMRDDGLFFTSLDRILMNETWVGKFGSGSNNLILGKSAGGTLGYNGGNNNISIGFQAGIQLGASSEKNVLIGTNVGYSMTSGSANMFLGYQAGLYTSTGGENMAIGVEAFRQNETGTGNVAIGSLALYTGISHVYNTGIGYQTGYLNTGDYGVFIGFRAGYNNGSGSNNTYLGSLAAYNMSTGSNNTVIGYSGATTLNNGSTTLTNATNGVYIGYQTRGNANSETNAIVIGYQANGLGSNTVVLGNDSITTTALKGNVGVGTTSPTAKLQVTGASGTLLAVDLATDRRVFSVGSAAGTYTGNILNVDSGYVTITGRVANGLALDVVPGGLFGIRTYGGTNQYSFLANRSDAATQVLRIGGDGTVTIGNVANSSTHTLQVRGFGASSATNAIYVTNTSAANLFTVRDDGNIGINTSAPGSLLTLNTSFASTNGLTISSDNSSDSQIIIRRAASKPVLGLLAFDTATYITNGVYYDGGNWIHHSDGNDNSILSFDPGVGASWYASNNGSGSWNVANNITLWDSTGYWKSLVRSTESGDSYFTGGNVGIGTSSPSVKLEVSGGDINFDSNTFYLDSTNNRVGIKTNSPQTNFHLDGTIRIDNQIGGAPSGPTGGASPSNYWGTSSSDMLSTPNVWLKINLDGNDYYIPAYS